MGGSHIQLFGWQSGHDLLIGWQNRGLLLKNLSVVVLYEVRCYFFFWLSFFRQHKLFSTASHNYQTLRETSHHLKSELSISFSKAVSKR
jgi:hypothetical protein